MSVTVSDLAPNFDGRRSGGEVFVDDVVEAFRPTVDLVDQGDAPGRIARQMHHDERTVAQVDHVTVVQLPTQRCWLSAGHRSEENLAAGILIRRFVQQDRR